MGTEFAADLSQKVAELSSNKLCVLFCLDHSSQSYANVD